MKKLSSVLTVALTFAFVLLATDAMASITTSNAFTIVFQKVVDAFTTPNWSSSLSVALV